MSKTALITGITGQDGAYLAKFLLLKGYTVYGMASRRVNQSYINLSRLDIDDKVHIVHGDLIDQSSMQSVLSATKPDEIYNLAAQSFVGLSWQEPVYTAQVNAMGVLYLLEAVRTVCPEAKVYQASTSEMYGNSGGSERKNETTPFVPRSPYGVAKCFAHNMAVNYRESYNMFICCGILFNHESPLRGLEFVTRKITHGIAKIKLGLAENIVLGNLDAHRDWGFAGDYVEGMWLMMQQETPDDFVLATGKTKCIGDFLHAAFTAAEISPYAPYVVQDPKFMRPAELDILLGDPSKAKTVLGWEPKVDFHELVRIMVKEDLRLLGG